MAAESIFSVANSIALAGWLLLVLAPKWRATHYLVLTGVVPLLLSAAYLVIMAFYFHSAEGGFGSLSAVMQLFTNPWVALGGWLHYLAFDLFVGSWQVRDAQHKGIHHLLVVPCLLLTFLLGPVGLCLYAGLRAYHGSPGVHG